MSNKVSTCYETSSCSCQESTPTESLHRTGQQIHYPDIVGAADPYILLVHQGMVEDVFIQDLESRGVMIQRSSPCTGYFPSLEQGSGLNVGYRDRRDNRTKEVRADYLVGCDGAHSSVRDSMDRIEMEGKSQEATWGVLDGVLDTDFPDLWHKTVVRSEKAGTVLLIPRERNMTRLYIELDGRDRQRVTKDQRTAEYVMAIAKEILHPFKLEWKRVEWFGSYDIKQAVASHFSDDNRRVFLAGDAAHTHSPKAAQGMNTSMHDSLNLAWKLNLAVRGLASTSLLRTYELERRKIAEDLIRFDIEHVQAFEKGEAALAQNFTDNIRFISGVGAEYDLNCINKPSPTDISPLKPGALLPPARATRFIDANPVDLQIDIPCLGQFRIYFISRSGKTCLPFLNTLCTWLEDPKSFLCQTTAQAKESYEKMPVLRGELDEYYQPERYTQASPLFTYSLITAPAKGGVEIADLPSILRESPWTIYTADIKDDEGNTCLQKWFPILDDGKLAILNVRPDGYVGSFEMFDSNPEKAQEAGLWLDAYYRGILDDSER